jgi:hypothetical protein
VPKAAVSLFVTFLISSTTQVGSFLPDKITVLQKS